MTVRKNVRPSRGLGALWLAVTIALLASPGRSQGQGDPGRLTLDVSPIFRLEAGGPLNQVKGLAFSGDGRTLYVAGWDKVVQVWRLEADSQTWTLDRRATLRVPIGPGLEGAINALAVSREGGFVAAAGRGTMRDSAGFRQPGEVLPIEQFPEASLLDLGRILVFEGGREETRSLVGHRGSVLALAISAEGGPDPVLASAAMEGREVVVRAWDVRRGRPLGMAPAFLPGPSITGPSLAIRREGPDSVAVALAWGDRSLRTWRFSAGKAVEVPSTADGLGIAVVAEPNSGRWWSTRFRNDEARGALVSLPSVEPGFAFPAGGHGRTNYLPEALALVAVPPSKVPDHAAVILRAEAAGAKSLRYSVQLVPLDEARQGMARPAVQPGGSFGRESSRARPCQRTGRIDPGGVDQARRSGNLLGRRDGER